MYLALRLLHIVAMTTWFASGLFLPGDARRTVREGGDLEGLRGRMRRQGVFAAVGALSTVVTGLALIVTLGGFGAVPRGIHLGLGFALLAWAVGALGLGGAMRGLDRAIASRSERPVLDGFVRRMMIFSGIYQLLWTAALVCMVYRGRL